MIRTGVKNSCSDYFLDDLQSTVSY